MQTFFTQWENWLWTAGIVAGAIILAFVARFALFAIISRLARHDRTLLKDSLIRRTEKHSHWIFPLLAVVTVLPAAPLPEKIMSPMQHIVGLVLIGSVAWLVILLSDVVTDVIEGRYRMDVADNLAARKIQTQIRVLHRVVTSVVVLVTIAIMLMTIPAVRQIGTSLLASAGLAGLVFGMAMRPTLSSLIAGIQIALTQPIRIDDAVVVEGEWGWIEDIGATFVVVRIWDLRRLVLPLSYFIEHPFQNWTRNSADLLGSVFLWVDYSVPVEELRQELTRILKSTDKWKGEVNVLQVTDTSEHTLQIRALMDARDSGLAWDLRCYVREKLVQFLQDRYPQCLPRFRAEFQTRATVEMLPANAPSIVPGLHGASSA